MAEKTEEQKQEAREIWIREFAAQVIEGEGWKIWNQKTHSVFLLLALGKLSKENASLEEKLAMLATFGLGGNASQFAQMLDKRGILKRQAASGGEDAAAMLARYGISPAQ